MSQPEPHDPNDRYRQYCRAIDGHPLPAALVDLDALDRNARALLAPVRAAGLRLRLASKSVRCVALLHYLTERGEGSIHGLMAYAVREADHLVAEGFRDILVAYPTMHPGDLATLARLNREGAQVSVVVDCAEHLDALERAAQEGEGTVPVVVEVDMSYRLLDGRVHLGVRRSPLHTPEEVVQLAQRVQDHRHLRFLGVMGYEAQIAGVTDDNPHAPSMNLPKRLVKRLSRGRVEQVRRRIADGLAERGIPLDLFNGGGTGSLDWSSQDAALTEVTAGSGFLCPHLFDYYRGLRLEPAACFALQVVRRPGAGYLTCHGGGYVASGEPGADRLPLPYLPRGLELLGIEGAGEVQTPLAVPQGVHLALGDPVFFRHAKAGELAEHFDRYLLVRGDRVASEAPTYRGSGHAFL